MILKIAVLISGRGSNMLALKNACDSGEIRGRILCVVSNREEAKGIEAARNCGLPVFLFSKKNYTKGRYRHMSNLFSVIGVNFISLAGYDELIRNPLLSDFSGRIVNIHPAPLPEFGGKGMFGENVHLKILESGVKYTGPTVHLVDEKYDSGEILSHEPVEVLSDDTPDVLAKRVLEAEHRLYARTLGKISRDEIRI